MPLWKKLFSKKSGSSNPSKNSKDKPERRHTTEIEEDNKPSPGGERKNFNYNLSVSRSGRYKSKERKRVAMMDDPDFFAGGKNSPDNARSPSNAINGPSNQNDSSSNDGVAHGNCSREAVDKMHSRQTEANSSQRTAAAT